MSDIIRFVQIEGYEALFDLGCGYLDDDKIGTYDGMISIYSAEAFLNVVDERTRKHDPVIVREFIGFEQKVWRNKKYV